MRLVLVLAFFACGGGSPNQPAPAAPATPPTPVDPAPPAAPAPPPAAPGSPAQASPPITADAVCSRMAKLASSCEAFAKLSMSPEACASEVGGLLRREHPDPQLMSFLSCVIKSNGCDATQP